MNLNKGCDKFSFGSKSNCLQYLQGCILMVNTPVDQFDSSTQETLLRESLTINGLDLSMELSRF